jgi:hypothetical protein
MFGNVNDEIATAANAWFDERGLHAGDLSGQQVYVARCDQESVCRFFFPESTLAVHHEVADTVAKQLENRGAKVVFVSPTLRQYTRWSDGQGFEDTREARRYFATRLPTL